MAPFFREVNLSRIKKLKGHNLADDTIAGIVRDQTGCNITAQDISSYVKVSDIASERMLVTKKTIDAVLAVDEYEGFLGEDDVDDEEGELQSA